MSKITRFFVGELARRLEQKLPFIQAVIGPRQVGKTTGVLQVQEQLRQPLHYVSADLPVPPNYEWVREQWVTARSQAGEADGVLVLDEIQKIPGWSEVVKSLFDDERRRKNPLQVVILGSASWTLQAGLSETLAGRYELLNVHHWNFHESQLAFGWDINTYLKFGGYPAAALLVREVQRWQQFMRDSIIEPMLSRDLLTIREVLKPALFRQTLQLALAYPAQEISLQKLLGQLQEGGNTTTIKGYLELLEAGSVLKTLPKYSTRPLSVKSSSPKIVPMCSALIHAFCEPSKFDANQDWQGRIFEAAIGAKLIQAGLEVFYWRSGNAEVDYVVKLGEDLVAMEVKSGRLRRTSGLKMFKEQFSAAHCLIVNKQVGESLLSAEDIVAEIKKLIA